MERDIHVSVKDLIAFLVRGLPAALLVSIVVGIGAYYYSSTRTPVYAATATLYAGVNGLDLRSVGLSFVTAPSLHVDAYRAAVHSDSVMSTTLADLGNANPTSEDVRSVRSSIVVRTDSDSRLVHIDARADSAAGAAALATAVARALVTWDGRRASSSLEHLIETLEERIATLDRQMALTQSNGDQNVGSQADGLAVLRIEQETQLAYARTLANSVVGLLELVRPAVVPAEPVAPSPLFDSALAALLGLIVVYVVLFARLATDTRIRTREELSEASGLPVLASYAKVKRKGRLSPDTTDFLRTSVTSGLPTDGPYTLMVTSAHRMEGKTSVAMSLAEAYAACGTRTLLIDADLHRPSIGERYGLAAKRGPTFVDCLRAPDADVQPTVVALNGNRELDVLPASGVTERPSELLGMGFDAALQRWSREYEMVIVDTPPVLAVADPLSISSSFTGVLVVVDQRKSDRAHLEAAVTLLERHGANVLGLVVTQGQDGSGYYPVARRSTSETRLAQSDVSVTPLR